MTFMLSDAPPSMTFMIELAIIVLAAVALPDRAKTDSNRRKQPARKAPADFRIQFHHLPTLNFKSWTEASIRSVFDSCMSSEQQFVGLNLPCLTKLAGAPSPILGLFRTSGSLLYLRTDDA